MTFKNKALSFIKSIAFIATYLFFGALLSPVKYMLPDQYERYAQGILGTIGVLITVLIFLKLEKKSFKDYGLNWEKKTVKKFGIGLLLGIGLALLMMLSQISFSNLQLSLNEDVSLGPFLLWSLAFIPLAFMEEVAFRSYPLLKLNQAFGFRSTQIILAILFAAYHMFMMWGVKESLLGPGIWALAYALAAVMSKGIAVPTGLHFGLNFVQSVLGGQKGIKPLWEINYPENVTEMAILRNEQFGLGIQILLLLLCITATEMHIRKRLR